MSVAWLYGNVTEVRRILMKENCLGMVIVQVVVLRHRTKWPKAADSVGATYS